MTQNLTT